MKAISFANRLVRDLKVSNITELSADGRLELLDAINGGLQKIHALSKPITRETVGSLFLAAPLQITLDLENGSAEVGGYSFPEDDLYRTLRIDGDDIDNQVVGVDQLLHPYGGATGPVLATLYADAVTIREPYDQLVGDPRILETHTDLIHARWEGRCRKQVKRPFFYHVEANARNQNSAAPSVIRFDSLPGRSYRLQGKFTMAPARVAFTDLLSPGADIPMRTEHIEAYLLPIARGLLASSSLWREPTSKAATLKAGEDAESNYETLTPATLATPNNRVGTRRGY